MFKKYLFTGPGPNDFFIKDADGSAQWVLWDAGWSVTPEFPSFTYKLDVFMESGVYYEVYSCGHEPLATAELFIKLLLNK